MWGNLTSSGENIYYMNKSKLWNLKAKFYQGFRNRFPFRYILQQENNSLLALLDKIPQIFDSVIDLGTGEGNALQLISNHTRKIGVDFSLAMLLNAQERIHADFINCELSHLPLKNKIADLVLIIGVLEYLSEFHSLFKEINRISKANAYVIISYSPNNIWTFLRQFLGHKIYALTYEKMVKLIEINGFAYNTHHRTLMQCQMLIKKHQ